MTREYYDRDDVDSIDDDESGESYFREQLSGYINKQKKNEEFNFNKEANRLTSKVHDVMEVIEREIWLINGAIGDAEIAEFVCKARLVRESPFADLAPAIRDLHNGGKAPSEIFESIQGWPWISDIYKERLEYITLEPEEKEAFFSFYRRQCNEAGLREILEYATRKEYLYRPENIVEILSKYNPSEIQMPRKVGHMRTPDDVKQWLKRINMRDAKRLKTSYLQINLYSGGGLKLGALYCVAAPTGVGKSIVLCWLCADFTLRGYRILFVSTEMVEDEVYERINRCMTDTHTNEEATLKMMSKLKELEIFGYDVWCAEELSSTVAEIEQKAKEGDYDVVLVDYGDKLSAGVRTENEYNKQGVVFSQLARLAKRLDIPVIVASQQNRESLKNPKGGMENIGDSIDKLRPLEMLFSIPYYDHNKMPEMRNRKDLLIQKNRSGVKDVELFFDIDYLSWRMSEPQYVRECITANQNLGPQEIYFKILDAQKEIKKESKNASPAHDKND